MIGLIAHPSTGSGQTVKPCTVSRFKWVDKKRFKAGVIAILRESKAAKSYVSTIPNGSIV
ncbi:hypothetical protein [Crenothrix sp.]|uniref:hypothetical protein n=1 Tax=Crenothrix sp. TaxID=3100433 RepID=UPI00374DBA51